jgi:flotillin
MGDLSPVVTAVLGIIIVLFVVAIAIVRRIKVAGPNEAFIITGRRGRATRDASGEVTTDLSGQKVVMGASVFVLPFVQQLFVMDLSSRRISISISGAVSAQGVKVDLDGVAIVKVGGNENMIRAAAQRFLNQQKEIDPFTQEVLAGSLRAIVGGLTVEEIIRDRAAFATKVAEESETSLTGQGLVLDTFQIQDVRTEGSYLDDLGRPEQARVRQDADIAEARARQAAEKERLLAEESIAVAERQLALRKAEILAETDAAGARAEAAGPLARAAQEQAVLAEQEKVAERQALLKDRELDTEVRKPADAERYRVEQEAEAAKTTRIAEAEAQRQATVAAAQAAAEEARLLGEAEKARRSALADAVAIEGARQGDAERARRVAIAEAVRAEGENDAAAIAARGAAEAEALQARAEAFERYGEVAVLEMIIGVLPEVVGKASEPMGAIGQMTVISTDGAGQLTKQVSANLAQGLQIASDLTGLDVKTILGALGRRVNGGTDAVAAAAATAAGDGTGGGAAGGAITPG